MAQETGGEWYTAFTFTENGRSMHRRIHRMEVQANDGHLYVLEGRELPDRLDVNTGVGHRGKHLATVLLHRKNAPPPPKIKQRSWPNPRDVANLAVGIFLAVLLVRILNLLVNVNL